MKAEGKDGIKDKMRRDRKTRIGKFILLYLISFCTNISEVFIPRLCGNGGWWLLAMGPACVFWVIHWVC